MSYTSGIFAKAARQVQQDDNNGIPFNTQLAFGQKGEEFLEYCTSIFSCCGYSTQIVTEEKVFGFLFYQSYRMQRKRGCKKRQVQTKNFNVDNYHTVMAKYNSNKGAACEPMLETDPVGYDTVNQYYCSILKILQHQRSQNANNLTKEHLCTDRVAQLLCVVQVRKKMIKKM